MGSDNTDKKVRQRLRKSLREAGASDIEIATAVAALREKQGRVKGQGRDDRGAKGMRGTSPAFAILDELEPGPVGPAYLEQLQDETYGRLNPDDRRFRPATPPPLSTGQARVTGVAARAVKRGQTFTKWQIDELEAR